MKNKGTGAGGAKTNENGKNFEKKTNNEENLLKNGYIKINLSKSKYYLSKKFKNKTIDFVIQNNFKTYVNKFYNIEIFRNPDEAYIINYNSGKKIIKILEKKNQNVNGSVFLRSFCEKELWSGPSLKREYELVLGEKINAKIKYYFCINEFLKNKFFSNQKKYKILDSILQENNIKIFFGDDLDYFQKFNKFNKLI